MTYDREKIDGYNEMPWGLGGSKYYLDEEKNKHSLYALVFADSHNSPEPMVGYAWQKNWHLDDANYSAFSLGYTFLITARKDYGWVPFPGVVPTISLSYKKFEIQSNYVPGVQKNTGNVLFTTCKWQF